VVFPIHCNINLAHFKVDGDRWLTGKSIFYHKGTKTRRKNILRFKGFQFQSLIGIKGFCNRNKKNNQARHSTFQSLIGIKGFCKSAIAKAISSSSVACFWFQSLIGIKGFCNPSGKLKLAKFTRFNP
jgi:hypothetical protein